MRVVGQTKITIVQGDITTQSVDVIVNAANSALAVGGGVDGAIHRVGGPAIHAETRERYPDGCLPGSAVISGAGNLPANWVIHAVGPMWRRGDQAEAEKLAGAYRRSLELATEVGAESIAFPAISTGVYAYPLDEAAAVAINAVTEYLEQNQDSTLKEVRFVLFDNAALDTFTDAVAED